MRTESPTDTLASPGRLLEMLTDRFGAFEAIAMASIKLAATFPKTNSRWTGSSRKRSWSLARTCAQLRRPPRGGSARRRLDARLEDVQARLEREHADGIKPSASSRSVSRTRNQTPTYAAKCSGKRDLAATRSAGFRRRGCSAFGGGAGAQVDELSVVGHDR